MSSINVISTKIGGKCVYNKFYVLFGLTLKRHTHDHSNMYQSRKIVTVRTAINYWKNKFAKNSISEPKESIVNITAHVLGTCKLTDVYRRGNEVLSPTDLNKLNELCQKRLERMPVQYIIEEWDFRKINLKMKSPVFIPTNDTTEMFVDLVLRELNKLDKGIHILEPCCGTGAICLSLLHERPDLKITAVDRSKAACSLTKENAQRLGLEKNLCIHNSEITDENSLKFIQGQFDVIVSNPPYVCYHEIYGVAQEVTRYEDLRALDGGKDGLELIKLILSLSPRLLKLGGKIFLEVNAYQDHANLISAYLQDNDFLNLSVVAIHKDLSNRDRYVEIIKR